MHEVLNSLKQHPPQKFHKNFINFEKPQKFPKSPKVWSKMHEMYDKRMKRGSYLWKMQDQNQRKSGEMFLSDWEVFWEVKRLNGSREIKKNEWEITLNVWIETS